MLFIHSSVDGHSGSFYFLAIMNNAAMSTYLHVFVWTCVLIFLVYIPRDGTAGSCGNAPFRSSNN